MNFDYYILKNGEQTGPFTFEELVDKRPDIHTSILSTENNEWQDACDLPELYDYFWSRGIYFPTVDNFAPFPWRLLAYIIDTVLLAVLLEFVLELLAQHGHKYNPQSLTDLTVVSAILAGLQLIYYTGCEATPMKGTLGKKLCRLVVVDADGVGLNFFRALTRAFGKIISQQIFYFGFFSVLFSEHKQAMHDYMAKSYVVKLF